MALSIDHKMFTCQQTDNHFQLKEMYNMENSYRLC